MSMMRFQKKWLLVVLVAIAAFSAGRFSVKRELVGGSTETSFSKNSQVTHSNRGGDSQNSHTTSRDWESGNVEIDSRPPIRSLKQLLEIVGQKGDVHHALSGYESHDLVDLVADLKATDRRDSDARRLKTELYSRWAQLEPRLALDSVLKEGDFRLQQEVLNQAFGTLTERSLEEASEVFLTLPNHQTREAAAEAMVHRVQPEALPILATFLDEHVPRTGVNDLYRRWAESDPEAAAAMAVTVRGANGAVNAVARSWVETDPEAAMAWAKSLENPPQRQHALHGAVAYVADRDPAAAAGLIDQMAASHGRNELAQEIAHRWAREDVASALSWVQSLDPASSAEAMHALTRSWAETDPQGAANHVLSLSLSERRGALVEVSEAWARVDSDAAKAWIETLSPADAAPAMRGLVEVVSWNDPQSAADLVASWGEAASELGEGFVDLSNQVAEHWSRQDPAAAAAWAQSLPVDGEVRQEAVGSVAESWLRVDPWSAGEWIGAMESGRVRDVATEHLVDYVAENDPGSAYEWALTVSDPEHQADMLHHVFEQWQDMDPSRARATWESAPITSDQREQLSEIFSDEQ